jgi:tetratricopeptide (TPR) repeat protein
MKIQSISLFLILITINSLAQQVDGYWDKQRITTKEIKLSAGDKITIKSEDFPVGTTEYVYRVTLLDDNQKIVKDLATVLNAIPDPYYIGKGTGGAISLVSAISGSDKCTYAIFSDEIKAKDFAKTGNIKNACLYQPNPVSKDAKLVSVEKSTCLKDESLNIWFGFENTNWLLGEKIVLEIVPWVDIKASHAWNQASKKATLFFIKSSEMASRLPNPDSFSYNVFEKIQKEYRFAAFQKLSTVEKIAIINKYENAALIETNNIETYNAVVRQEAKDIASQAKYEKAIQLIKEKLINKSNPTPLDYNALAELYIFTKQFEKALKTLKIAEKLDSSELLVQLNLAHTYMFLDNMSMSRAIHNRFKSQNVNASESWKVKTLSDIEFYKRIKLPEDNFKKIYRLFN